MRDSFLTAYMNLFRTIAVAMVVLFIQLTILGQVDPPTAAADKTAEALVAQAEELIGKGNVEALRRAASTLADARRIYKESGDRDGECGVLYRLGMTHAELLEYEIAKKFLEEAFLISKALMASKESHNPANAARISNQLGLVSGSLNQTEEAQFYLNQALEMYRSLKVPFGVQVTLVNLAKLQEKLGQGDKARDLYEQALEVSRDAKDGHEGFILQKLGDLHKSLKQYDKARENYEKELAIARDKKDRETEGIVLGYIGSVYLDSNDYEKAQKYYENSLAVFREIKNLTRQGEALVSLGLVYASQKRLDKALQYFTEALAVYRENHNRLGEAYALFNLGVTYSNLNQHEKALDFYRKDYEICRELKLKDLEGMSLTNIGDAYNSLNQYENARNVYEQALSLSKERSNRKQEGILSERLGTVHANLNEYEKALTYFMNALAITRELKNQRSESLLLVKLGQMYYSLKQYEKIYQKNIDALNVATAIKYLYGQSNALNSLGQFYLAVGQHDKARISYEQALTIAIEDNNRSEQALALSGLGDVSNLIKQSANANTYFARSLKLARQENDRYLEAYCYLGFGISYKNLEDYDKAIENLERARSLAVEAGATFHEMLALNELGIVHLNLNHLEKARQFSERALKMARESVDPEREANSLLNLMQVWDKEGNPSLGVFYGKQFINMIQTARLKFKNYEKDLQQSFLKSKEESYRDLADTLIRLGRIPEAERVLAMLKEEEYFDFLRRDDKVADALMATLPLTPDEQKAFNDYKKYADSLTALGKEYGDLQAESKRYEVGQFPKQKRLDKLDKLLADATKVFNTFLDDLKNKFSESSKNGGSDLRVALLESGSQSLLKELGQPNTVMISTIAGEDRLNIIVTTADAQRAHTVDLKSADLNKLVSEFRLDVKNRNIDPRISGKQLYDALFPASLRKDLEGVKADTIVWSLDGTLRYVPIAALWDGKQYLVEKYKNVLVTLASRDKLGSSSADRSKWQALGVGVSKQATLKDTDGTPRNFEALSSVPEELCSVIADPDEKKRCSTVNNGKTGVVTGKSLLDEQFTLQSFKNSLGRYPIVHIASHFSLNTGNENDSYLLLGGGDQRKLTLADVRQGGAKFSGVELLTLSACNTAMSTGNRSNGVEVESFGASAQNQGAKSVVASLWAVADTSTRDLMIEFYKQLEATPKVNKAEAMQRAQLTLLRGKYPHPYYWSPFILMGNWQ